MNKEDKAYWAAIHLDHAYAAEWRNHKYILIREGKPTNQKTLFRFIKKIPRNEVLGPPGTGNLVNNTPTFLQNTGVILRPVNKLTPALKYFKFQRK